MEFDAAYKKYHDDAYLFVKEIIAPKMITKQQELVLRALGKHKRLAVKSGHGVGKSALSSWLTLWFMFTRPLCKVAMTAPSQHQLEDILWSELKKWTNKSDVLYELFEIRKTRMVVRDARYEELWFAVPISVRKPENLQGFHADDLLFIVDEASGVPANVFEPIEGALTSDGAFLVMFGNPTQVSGVFYDAFHKHAKHYKTFTFSSEDSPLVSKEYIKTMREKFGYDSNVYRIRVLGEFPLGASDSVVPIEWVERAFLNDESDIIAGDTSFGVDTARYGDDETVIAVVNGNHVVEINRYKSFDTIEVADEVERLAYVHHPTRIKIEMAANGSGVFDILKRKRLPGRVVPFLPAAEPVNKTYADSITEAWFNMRDYFKPNLIERPGIVVEENIELLEQVSSRCYGILPNGRYKLEDKNIHKKRNRGVSPDIGDALSIALYDGKMSKNASLKENRFIERGGSAWEQFKRVRW